MKQERPPSPACKPRRTCARERLGANRVGRVTTRRPRSPIGRRASGEQSQHRAVQCRSSRSPQTANGASSWSSRPERRPSRACSVSRADHRITAAAFTGLGAFSDATLGFFDFATKDYERIRIDEQVEVVTLVGNFATQNGEAKLHPHVVVSKRSGQAFGGHLLEAHVRPTLEVVVTESPAELRRETDEATGLPLLVL